MQQYEEGIENLDKSIKLEYAYYYNAIALNKLKKPDLAVEYINKAIELAPKNKVYQKLYKELLNSARRS